MVISVGGSSSRRRTSPISHPTARPTATPPPAATMNSIPAWANETPPSTAATTATR